MDTPDIIFIIITLLILIICNYSFLLDFHYYVFIDTIDRLYSVTYVLIKYLRIYFFGLLLLISLVILLLKVLNNKLELLVLKTLYSVIPLLNKIYISSSTMGK